MYTDYYPFCILSFKNIGRIPLNEATLIEDPNDQFQFVVDDGGKKTLADPRVTFSPWDIFS